MISSMFSASTVPVLEQVVNFTEARHGVLAGNIANLDTPGYRSRDLSTQEFESQLKDAIESQREAAKSARAEYPYAELYGGGIAAEEAEQPLSKVTDAVRGMLRHDDNNTSLEEHVSAIAKNQAEHNLALSLMNAQFRLLRAAITERA